MPCSHKREHQRDLLLSKIIRQFPFAVVLPGTGAYFIYLAIFFLLNHQIAILLLECQQIAISSVQETKNIRVAIFLLHSLPSYFSPHHYIREGLSMISNKKIPYKWKFFALFLSLRRLSLYFCHFDDFAYISSPSTI